MTSVTRGYLDATHPLPAIAVTGAAAALAVVGGRTGQGVGVVVVAALLGQVSVGWSNDAIDANRDRAQARLSKPVVRGAVDPHNLWAAAVVALLACVAMSTLLGARGFVAHLVALAAAWAYNLGVKSTVWSWLPYGVAFAALPLVAWSPPTWPPLWVLLACALLGVGAHIANVLPDVDDDRASGVHGAVHRLPERSARAVMALVFLAAMTVATLGPPGAPSPLGVAALGAAVVAIGLAGLRRTRPHDRTAFRAGLVVGGLAATSLAAGLIGR